MSCRCYLGDRGGKNHRVENKLNAAESNASMIY